MTDKKVVARVVPVIVAAIFFVVLLFVFPSIQYAVQVQGQWLFSLVVTALVYIVLERAWGKLLPEPSKRLEEIGIAQAREKQRLEDMRKWKENYQDHSRLIGKTVFDGWKINSGILASWTYDGGQLTISLPKGPDIEYIEQAKSHLREGYHDFWTLFQRSQAKSVEMSSSARLWVESFEKVVTDKVRSSCPQVDVSMEGWVSPVQERRCYIRSIFDIVFSQARFNATGKLYGGFNIGDLNTDVKDDNGLIARKTVKYLSFSGMSLGHGNFADMQNLQQALDSLISDGLVQYYV